MCSLARYCHSGWRCRVFLCSVTFSASSVFKFQLVNDNSPGQLTFWYTLTPAVNGSNVMMKTPADPSPTNDAVVSLTITTDQHDVPYVLNLWSRDQAVSNSAFSIGSTW